MCSEWKLGIVEPVHENIFFFQDSQLLKALWITKKFASLTQNKLKKK